MKSVAIVVSALALMTGGCVRTIAVSTVGGIVDEGFSAFTDESDLAFAEQALPGNLKLLEVMLKNDPSNTRLLRLASEGYSSYALAFLEDKDPERARTFYLRGRDYGLRGLELRNQGIARQLQLEPRRAAATHEGGEAAHGLEAGVFTR